MGNWSGGAPTSDGSDSYTYDPRDPVPTLFGPGNFTCVADQRPLAGRADILVFQTEPLTERFEVTGLPEVELYAASSAPDTDWVARLIDVAPDGLARDVCMGVVRARYRDGVDKPRLIPPGKVLEVHDPPAPDLERLPARPPHPPGCHQFRFPQLRPQPQHGGGPECGRRTGRRAPDNPSRQGVPLRRHSPLGA